MENPIKMDDLGAPPFSDLHMYCRPKLKWPTVADSTERMGRKKTLGFRFKAKLCMKATWWWQPLCFTGFTDAVSSPSASHPIPTSAGLDFALCTNTCTTSQDAKSVEAINPEWIHQVCAGLYVVPMWSPCGPHVVPMWSPCGPHVVPGGLSFQALSLVVSSWPL